MCFLFFHWWFFRLNKVFVFFLWSKYRVMRNTQTTNPNQQLSVTWNNIFSADAACIGNWSWMRMALPPFMKKRKATRFPNDLRYAPCTRSSRGCRAHGCNEPSRESPCSRWRGMKCPPPLPIPSMASIRRRKGWSWDFGCNLLVWVTVKCDCVC